MTKKEREELEQNIINSFKAEITSLSHREKDIIISHLEDCMKPILKHSTYAIGCTIGGARIIELKINLLKTLK